jgi:O-antigen ligase
MFFLQNDIKDFKEDDKLSNFILIIYLLMPVFLMIGTAISELAVITLCFIFLYNFFYKKENIFKNNLFYFLIIIYFSLLINLVYSVNIGNSILRNIFFIKYIVFCLGSVNFLSKKGYRIFFVFKFWLIIMTIFSLDLFIQFFFGKNIIGLESPLKFHRVSGFMNEELKAGSLTLSIALITSGFMINNTKYKNLGLIFLIFFLSTIFITGDRSNFIKSLLVVFSLLFIFKEIYLKKMILLLIVLTFFIGSILTNNEVYKVRYSNNLFGALKKNNYNLITYVNSTEYGKLYYTGYKLFTDNKIFGVGNKNFRMLCNENFREKLIKKIDVKKKNIRCNTHPHQIYIEIIAEHGLFGLLILLGMLLIFIISNFNFISKKNNLLLGFQFLILMVTFLPILPGGSFFTSFNATLFWMNLGFFYAHKKILSNNI